MTDSEHTTTRHHVWISAVLAAAIHAVLILAWRLPPVSSGIITPATDLCRCVEVSLVSSPTQAELESSTIIPPQNPPPPAPAAPPVSQQEPAVVENPQIALPSKPPTPSPASLESLETPRKEPNKPEPTRQPTTPPTKSSPPAVTERPTKAASSPTNGSVNPTSNASLPAFTPSLLNGKPVYTTPPQIRYPPESKAQSEQGTVILRITVNAAGRPTAVTVARSSGFQRLDRAAVEGGWRCRISNGIDGAHFEAPMRFELGR